MSHYSAEVVDGFVTRIVVGHVDVVSTVLEGNWHDVPDDGPFPGPGWGFDGNTFIAPAIPEEVDS